MEEHLEAEIRSIGAELHERLQRSRRRGSRLDEGLMDLAGGDPELRAAVMRFVDVYPACRGPRDVAVHLVQHLSAVEDAPGAVRLARALGETPARDALALPAAVAVRRMARRFIVGTSPRDALGFLREQWERGVATTIDLLGELTVSRAEGNGYRQRCIAAIEALSDAGASWPQRSRLERDSRGPLPRANLSVKISALTPKLPARSPATAAEEAATALKPILAAAQERSAHVHVDMEHFDLLEPTRRALLELLARPELGAVSSGLVIQAYLRDAERIVAELIDWARAHPRSTPLTVRLVKGAYWDHEVALAAQNGWDPPVWAEKEQTDAVFERLTARLLQARPLLRVAVGSHNLRSVAHAIALNRALGGEDRELELQVLHGLGDSLAEALAEVGFRVRAYCPVGDLVSGMGYLVRRLLENSANQSFVQLEAEGRPLEELLAPPRRERSAVGQ